MSTDRTATPVATTTGSAAGMITGATVGDGIGEAVNPAIYGEYWKQNYATKPYFVRGHEWSDYEPAYQFGYQSFSAHRGRKYPEVESDLKRTWDAAKGKSRLLWEDAKEAVQDGWHYVERAVTGDSDRGKV